MNTLPVVVVTVGAAGSYALAATLKHRSAEHVPDAQDLRPRQVRHFIQASVTHRLWLGGIVADAIGLALQVYALRIGALAVVQPLLVVGLLFALALHHATGGGRISRTEFGTAVALVVSLVAFLVISGATDAKSHNGSLESADRGPAVAAGILAVVAAATLVTLTRHVRRGPAAAMLGVTAGISYAASASLIKSCTNIANGGALDLLTSWQLYVLLAVGAAGLLLNQLAFQAGPLAASLSASTMVDPLVSIAIGVWVYDERLRHTAGATIAELLCLGCFASRPSRSAGSRPNTRPIQPPSPSPVQRNSKQALPQ